MVGTNNEKAIELNGDIGNLYSHYYEVKDLDPRLAEVVYKKVTNSFTTYIGQDSMRGKEVDNGFIIEDTKAKASVLVTPSRQFSKTIDNTTTVADIQALDAFGTTDVLRLRYEEYDDSKEGIDNIVEKIKQSLISKIPVTKLNNETSFDVKVIKSTKRFECKLKVRNVTIASIEGMIKYGIREGNSFDGGINRKTLYPTVRLVIDNMIGPKNKDMLRYMVAFLDNAIPADQAFELLNSATENRELITLLNKIGAKVDLKDISKLKKMFDGKKIIDIRLPFRIQASDKVAINGRIGDVSTVVTPYEGTLDPALATLLANSNDEATALRTLQQYTSNVHTGAKIVAGFTYLSTLTPGEIKQAMSDINVQTGLAINSNTSNLFSFSTNDVILGAKVQPQSNVGALNSDAIQAMMTLLQQQQFQQQ